MTSQGEEGEKGNSRSISKEYPKNKSIIKMYYFDDRGGNVSLNGFICAAEDIDFLSLFNRHCCNVDDGRC